jgi:purine-nucleoside/S-methyl-5'-thioadenosine phosphorylase / adenosine deaminase
MISVRRAANLERAEGIAHGFFGRTGGVSSGIYASLNCGPGSNDERAHVIENRRRVIEALAPDAKLVTVHQVHGAKAIRVTSPWEVGSGPEADAMVTNLPGIALGILTADCAPVLLADAFSGVIGAAHAGWKGANYGVVEVAVSAMEGLGARRDRISAAIGPCISQENYEVSDIFRSNFIDPDPESERLFTAGRTANHYQFDLESYVVQRLADTGVTSVERLSFCTYANESDYFSFRRTTHRGEKDYGRQISTIVLRK